MRQFIEFSQHAKPVVHMELFESKMAIERLSAPHFAMYENLSAVQGPRGNDLTKRCLNEFVSSDLFFANNKDKAGCVVSHDMLKSIELARRIAARELSTRLGYLVKDDSFEEEDQTDTVRDIFSGLEESKTLNVMKMMGAIAHPLF